MSKWIRLVWILSLVLAMTAVGILMADMLFLQENLVRFHVVAASDSNVDQQNKLLVRDVLISYLEDKLQGADDAEDALTILRDSTDALKNLAEETLASVNAKQQVNVTVEREGFPTREYDTFKLPAGVYNTLRVEIGDADGANWWCVVFPALCAPETVETFQASAKNAGFDCTLSGTLTQKNSAYELRFFLLDCIGKLENLFFSFK